MDSTSCNFSLLYERCSTNYGIIDTRGLEVEEVKIVVMVVAVAVAGKDLTDKYTGELMLERINDN